MLRIMPRQKVYFDSFIRCAELGHEAALLLRSMLEQPEQVAALLPKVVELEHEGDRNTDTVARALAQGLATPFGRAEILRLAEMLDDVIDGIESVATKLQLYRAAKARGEALELSALLAEETAALCEGLRALASGTDEAALGRAGERVRELEGMADQALRRGIGALFDELRDPFELIKWKELLELLEQLTDQCEDVIRMAEAVFAKPD